MSTDEQKTLRAFLLAFHKGDVREVVVENPPASAGDLLEAIFSEGQKEVQDGTAKGGLSAGDVIELSPGTYWQILASGFKPVTQEELDALLEQSKTLEGGLKIHLRDGFMPQDCAILFCRSRAMRRAECCAA